MARSAKTFADGAVSIGALWIDREPQEVAIPFTPRPSRLGVVSQASWSGFRSLPSPSDPPPASIRSIGPGLADQDLQLLAWRDIHPDVAQCGQRLIIQRGAASAHHIALAVDQRRV